MANIKYNIEEINDLQRLGNRDKEELLAEFQTCKGLADRGDLEALYRCFELNTIIELKDCQKIEYDGKAFTYLKEAAQRGYTKAIKTYIVLVLEGMDIMVEYRWAGVGKEYYNRFLGIWTPETAEKWDRYRNDWEKSNRKYSYVPELAAQMLWKSHISLGTWGVESAERAIRWLTDEAKRQPDVKELIRWVEEEKVKSMQWEATMEKKRIETEKYNEKIFWIMRLVTGIVCVIAGIVAYVLC